MSYPQNPSEQPEGGHRQGGPPPGGSYPSPAPSGSQPTQNVPGGAYGAPQGQGHPAGWQGGYGGPGGPGTPSQYAGPPLGPGGNGGMTSQSKSFFAKLFDFSFTTYVTPSIVKVVYILAIIFVVLAWLVISFSAFASSVGLGLLVLLIVGPIYALFMLVLFRITFEFYVAVIHIAEDVKVLSQQRR